MTTKETPEAIVLDVQEPTTVLGRTMMELALFAPPDSAGADYYYQTARCLISGPNTPARRRLSTGELVALVTTVVALLATSAAVALS